MKTKQKDRWNIMKEETVTMTRSQRPDHNPEERAKESDEMLL
jgi:hypothetical protein